jgi:hypothetical protein
MKLGSPYDDPEAPAKRIARQQRSGALLSLVGAIRADTAAIEIVAIIDALEDQLYPGSFGTLHYQAQVSDAHPVT